MPRVEVEWVSSGDKDRDRVAGEIIAAHAMLTLAAHDPAAVVDLSIEPMRGPAEALTADYWRG